ncbi:MAG: beta strand repeat-containing protein [Micromonosporaceae bacterium]
MTVKDGFGNPASGVAVGATGGGNFALTAGGVSLYGNNSFRGGTTNALGVSTITLFKTTYPTATICATVTGNQVCNTTPVTITGPTNLLFQSASQVPPAPTGLTATTPTANAPALSWNTVSVAASYRVYRSGQLLGSTTTTSFVDSALDAGGSYSYTVTAVSALNIESPASMAFVVVYTSGPAVTNVAVNPSTISVGQTATLSATVTDAVASVVAAEYFESADPGEGHGLAMTVFGSTTSVTLPSNLALGPHTFTVRAKDSLGSWTRGTLPSATLTVVLPTLNGRVLNGANQGLSGVRIDVVSPSNHSNVLATTTSGSTGDYSVSASPGTYDVIYTPTGTTYQPTTKTAVNLTTSTTIDVVLVLVPRIFSGTVSDKNGIPIPGVTVRLNNAGGQTFSTITASDGSFSVDVNPATYSVTLSGTHTLAPAALVPATFSLGGGALDLTDNVDQNFTISAVTATFVTRSALTGATVGGVALTISTSTDTTVYAGSGSYAGGSSYGAMTDASGSVSVVLLSGSRYTVTAVPPTGSGVVATSFPQAGPIVADILVPLPLTADIRHFTGAFTDNIGAGLTGATIRLTGPLGTFQATTGPGGSFDVEAAAGTYTLTVNGSRPSGSGLHIPDTFSLSGASIDISSADRAQHLTLDAATVDVTAKSPFDTNVPDVEILITSAGGSATLFPGGSFTATASSAKTTNASGVASLFATKGLTYTTKATPAPGSGYRVTNLAASPVVATNTAWPIPLARDLKTFTGVVRDKNGAAVTGANVRLDGNEQDQHYVAVTNGSGAFSLLVAPNGAYALQISGTEAASPDAYVPDDFLLTTTIGVTGDTTRDVTVGAVKLDIVARDDRLTAIAGAGISFSSTGSQDGFAASSTGITRTTGADGRTSLIMLTGTTYTISATPPPGMGYINTTFNGTSPITQDSETIIEFQNHIPLAPTGLSATSPTTSQPALTWNPIANADHYAIYRGTSIVGTSATTSFTDTTLTADGSYAYRVSAVSADNYEGPRSSSVTVLYDTTAPTVGDPQFSANPKQVSQPTDVNATASDSGSGVAGGEYFLGTDDPGQGQATAMAFAAGTLTATIGTDLTAGSYTVNVRARDILGTWSAIRSATLIVARPAAPSGLTANTPTNQDPVLNWAASPDAAAYYVYRDGTKLVDEPTTPTFTDTGRTDGSYSYSVRVVNAFGDQSDLAGPVTVLVDKLAPTISYTLDPTPNSALWNNTAVTVTFTCQDTGGSGIVACTTPVTVSADTPGLDVVGTAVDAAGNTRSIPATVHVDRTAPVLGVPTWAINPKPLTSSTTLTVAATDNLSDVVAGEYYIDTDPGAGAAIAMSASAGNLSATLGAALGVGVYQVGIRARDGAGNWSATTTTMLVVYDPGITVGITGKNKKDLVPSLANGDVLPGLTSVTQTEAADYGFTVDYAGGVLDPHNDFMFTYNTGIQCNSPYGQNCHSFVLSATSFDWMIIDQTNSSRGRFQGVATVTVDGVSTTNPFTVQGIDGDRLTPAANDQFTLKIYAPGANPTTASPLYQVTGTLASGNSVRVR